MYDLFLQKCQDRARCASADLQQAFGTEVAFRLYQQVLFVRHRRRNQTEVIRVSSPAICTVVNQALRCIGSG